MSDPGTKISLKHFQHVELACNCGCDQAALAPGFGDSLEALRNAFGKPMPVNSCCRCRRHNNSIGGHVRSLHLMDNPYHETGGTCAIDIAMVDAADRARLIEVALRNGWSVGVASNFIHLDRRTRYIGLAKVVFHYPR